MKNKKILILSADYDYSTNEIMKWLFYYGQDVIRVNKNEDFGLNEIRLKSIDENGIKTPKFNEFADIKSILFRRGKANISFGVGYDANIDGVISLVDYLKIESSFLQQSVHFLLLKKKCIGNPAAYQTNRIITQYLALESELKVPDSLITNSKDSLIRFYDQYDDGIAIKGIQEGMTLHDGKYSYHNLTKKLDENTIKNYPDKFGLTHFQQYIEKNFEIRVFYLKGIFYSMAIFSQCSELTKIDYRQYNDEWPNRYVPYMLDKQMEIKLRKVFKKLGLDNGSADLMVCKKNEIYFLEINPVGQFDNVSKLCNYYLDKKIAKKLI